MTKTIERQKEIRVFLPPKLFKAVAEAAADDERSMSAWIRIVVSQALKTKK